MPKYRILIAILILILVQGQAYGTDYFVHPAYGNDSQPGTSRAQAFQTLERAAAASLRPGDRLLLASGETFYGSLTLIDRHGQAHLPIQISSISWEEEERLIPARIDFQGKPNGIQLESCSFIQLSHLQLTGDGHSEDSLMSYNMRCGVLITNALGRDVRGIRLDGLEIFDVFFENEGFTRGEEEVRTANGTQRYGWGIRVINDHPRAKMQNLRIENCQVSNVSHTGIKFTGRNQNIRDFYLSGNEVRKTGGPGIQMSEVQDGHVVNNLVSHSGSDDDSRKWGRGSGLWTWGSSRILIEKNTFQHAHGPADSAGAHIDFNCDNIILQYNLSAHNAGGFCEVLGNTYQCAYRYNLSINDGHRIKGINGAFQEGKTLWLSGYQGQKRGRKGPVNFYFYNNTIYCDSSLTSKIAIDNTSKGVFIANNIFYLQGGAKAVLGDQYKPDTENGKLAEHVIFQNNLYLNPDCWPADLALQDQYPLFGDPAFRKAGGTQAVGYLPKNKALTWERGMPLRLLPADSLGLWQPFSLKKDLLGRPNTEPPGIGAILPGTKQ